MEINISELLEVFGKIEKIGGVEMIHMKSDKKGFTVNMKDYYLDKKGQIDIIKKYFSSGNIKLKIYDNKGNDIGYSLIELRFESINKRLDLIDNNIIEIVNKMHELTIIIQEINNIFIVKNKI